MMSSVKAKHKLGSFLLPIMNQAHGKLNLEKNELVVEN